MTAYAMAHVHHANFGPELVEYLRRIDATLEPFAGRFLVHGGPVEAVEGTWNGDLIIIEFPDLDSARGWYESPDYLKIRHLRTENTTADTITSTACRPATWPSPPSTTCSPARSDNRPDQQPIRPVSGPAGGGMIHVEPISRMTPARRLPGVPPTDQARTGRPRARLGTADPGRNRSSMSSSKYRPTSRSGSTPSPPPRWPRSASPG